MYCEYSSSAGSISAFDTAHILRVLTIFGVLYALLCRLCLFPLQAYRCSILRTDRFIGGSGEDIKVKGIFVTLPFLFERRSVLQQQQQHSRARRCQLSWDVGLHHSPRVELEPKARLAHTPQNSTWDRKWVRPSTTIRMRFNSNDKKNKN